MLELNQILRRFKQCDRFKLALMGIWIFSLVIRFWKLGQFNELVFDEIYYAKYSNNYLIGEPFFHSHPPLAQYIIAIGMAIGSLFPASPDIMNELTGSLRSTISYRWLNALSGSFFPLIVGGLAYQLSQRKLYTLLAAFLASLDGLFLVESRYALNNIYLVSFGLLGQLFCLWYLRDPRKAYLKLMVSGLFFGMAISIKWNGLGFLLGMTLFLFALWIKIRFLDHKRKKSLFPKAFLAKEVNYFSFKVHNIWQTLIILFAMTLVTYGLLWIPHLIMSPEDNFWQVHQKILSFHERVGGNSKQTHPYCSPWWTWPLMIRPVAYYYQVVTKGEQSLVYDVHAMGNPILWWCATLAILLLISLWCQRIFLGEFKPLIWGYPNYILLYIILNYLANFLPWITVSRCTFLYHYMGSYVFSWLGLAWILDRWSSSSLFDYRWMSRIVLLFIILGFIYWLPLYLGIPLSEEQFKLRLLFRNWI
ncbi:MAG: dolichyl-phosphate-mannose--protein mannosyltransferase [Microcystaceae cyanobacterium]